MNSKYYFVEHFKKNRWIPIGAWHNLSKAFQYSDSDNLRYQFIDLDTEPHKLDNWDNYVYHKILTSKNQITLENR